jgi:phage host-nuclease inhibitor protein Gam
MKNKRIKVQLPTITTRDEAESVMNEIACIANNQRRITTARDAEVLKINERYESSLSQCEQDLQQKTDALRVWAETNPDQFAKGRKSIDFVSGILGFRTGTPKLALTNRSWNWDKVTAAVMHRLPNFIRNKPEVDKEALIAQRDELADALPSCGIKVVQGESFFVEPKLTDVETRQTVEAA